MNLKQRKTLELSLRILGNRYNKEPHIICNVMHKLSMKAIVERSESSEFLDVRFLAFKLLIDDFIRSRLISKEQLEHHREHKDPYGE